MACVDLPAFPLQLLLRERPSWRGKPVAVVARERPQAPLLWVNGEARRAGVLPGQRYALALSRTPGLRAGVVAPETLCRGREEVMARLRSCAAEIEPARREAMAWVGSRQGEALHGLFWIDPRGHGPAEPWARRILVLLREAGFAASVAVGFTRFGTYAATRSGRCLTFFADPLQEVQAARRVPLARLELDPELGERLGQLGVETVGAFLLLPPEGVRERFGPGAYCLHRMASGDLQEPFQPLPEEAPLERRAVLDHAEADRERLLFLVKRLLHPLLAELGRRGQGVGELQLRLALEGGRWRVERLRPAAPTRSAVQLLELVRLRFSGESHPVEEVILSVRGEELSAGQLSLGFSGAPPGRHRRDPEAVDRALARLRAELGEGAVVRAALAEGHLPSQSFRWEPMGRFFCKPPVRVSGVRSFVRRIYQPPRAFAAGAEVRKRGGPYALSGGWWDSSWDREYGYAETRRRQILWIFYDRLQRRWFTEGRLE